MTSSDSLLRRHLGWVVAIKLVALFLLWCFFVRDSGTHLAGTGVPRWRALERIRRGFGEGPG